MARSANNHAPKKEKKPRQPSVVLTAKQEAYVEARGNGNSKSTSASLAGYANASGATAAESSEDVQKALKEIRSNLQTATKINREEVVFMLQRAYHMAESLEEPSSMVAAAREIGKMLGFYEPEKIKLELSQDQARLQKKYEIMSDAELLDIINGTTTVVDGEFSHVSVN